MAVRKHDNRETLWMKAGDLMVAKEYQRPLNARRVRSIVQDFDPEAFGVLEVSQRANGDLVIIDGQHRWTALMDMQWADQLVPVLVHTGLDLKAEARVFLIRNSAVKPKPLELFQAELIEKDPEALSLQAVVSNLGLTIGDQPRAGTIRAISSLRWVNKNGGAITLGKTLRILRDAWGLDTTSFNAEIIKAVGLMVNRYPQMDDKRMITILKKQTPQTLTAASHSRRSYTSYSTVTALVLVLVDQYNQRLRVQARLPQWVFSPDKRAWDTHEKLAGDGLASV